MPDCIRNYGFYSMECSGHGTCFTGRCICNPGWTSLADYEFNEYFDCDINTTTIVVFSSMTLALGIILIFLICRSFIVFYYSIYDFKTGIFIGFLFQCIGMVTYSLGKIVDSNKYIIGPNEGILPAISFCIIWIFQIVGWTSFVLSICNFLEGYSRVCPTESRELIRSRIHFLRQISPYMEIPAICGSIFLIMITIKPDQADMFGIAINLCLFITLTVEGSFVVFALSIFTREFGNFIKNHSRPAADIVKIYRVLMILYRVVIAFCLGFDPCLLCFAVISYLRRKSVYLNILMFFCMEVMTLLVLLTQKGTRRMRSASVVYAAQANELSTSDNAS